MEKRKTILLFSDLEGTILRESDGDYSNEEMNEFLSQIDKLQDLTEARVHIHIVSPVYQEQMENMMDKIDRNIIRYNMAHRESREILEIEGGAAYPETKMMSTEFLGDRITFLRKPINVNDFDTAQHGKEHYVRQWCRAYEESERDELIMAIYCGNGRNDIRAVNYINSLRKGFAVCPQNTRRELKERAFYVSDKCDLAGIAEGIQRINEEIEKRKANLENPDQKFKRAPGGVEL